MPLARRDPDPRRVDNPRFFRPGHDPQPRRRIEKVQIVILPCNPKPLGQLPRPRKKLLVPLEPPVDPHRVQPLQRLSRPNQNRRRMPRIERRDIKHPMHPVVEIHIRKPRLPKHDRVARGPSAKRMRSRIVAPPVSLRLHNPSPHPPTNQLRPHKRRGPPQNIPRQNRPQLRKFQTPFPQQFHQLSSPFPWIFQAFCRHLGTRVTLRRFLPEATRQAYSKSLHPRY